MVTVAIQSETGQSELLPLIGYLRRYTMALSPSAKGEEAPKENADLEFTLSGLGSNASLPSITSTQAKTAEAKPGADELPKMLFHVTGGFHYNRVNMQDRFVLNGVITEIGGTQVQQDAQIEYDARQHTGTTTIPRKLCAYTQQKEFYESQKREQQTAHTPTPQSSPKGIAKPHNRRKV